MCNSYSWKDDKMTEKPKRDLEGTRNSLLNAARELLTSGIDAEKVTSRTLAGRAGVNAAMINYCYGSREALLYEVYKTLLAEAQGADRTLVQNINNPGITPKEKLFMIHYSLMKLMIANFTLSRTVTQYILLNRSDEAGMESLPFIIQHFRGSKTEKECALIAFELTSLHEIAVLQHSMLKDRLGTDLTDDAVLKKYVRNNIDRFLGLEQEV